MVNNLRPHTLLAYGDHMQLKFEDYVEKVYKYPSEWKQKRDKMISR